MDFLDVKMVSVWSYAGQLMDKGRTWVRSGSRLLLVVLLVPLHGPVVAQHHFPQCLAEVSQAGDVAVCGDMLRQGGKEQKMQRQIGKGR